MATIPGFRTDITGASGSFAYLTPKGSWKVYVLPRGAHASQASSGQTITFDSAATASRFAVNDWVQISTSVSNIRQVMAVGGNSITVNSVVTVALNDRVFCIGQTQPTVNGSSATYMPNTLIRQRDDDASTLYTNSMLTTDSNGMVQGFGPANFYDLLVQDGNQALQGSMVDLAIGISTDAAVTFGGTVTINGPTTFTVGVSMGSTVTIGTTLFVNTILMRDAVVGGHGILDPMIYIDKTRGLTQALIPGTTATACKTVDIVTRFTGSTTGSPSLNGVHVINQYGQSGGGGGFASSNPITLGVYSEYRGGSDITAGLFATESASTMYSGGTVTNLFGILSTAQVTTGASSVVTGRLQGHQALARVNGSGDVSTPLAIGMEGVAGMQDTAGGTITDAIGGRFSTVKDAGVTGKILAATGVLIQVVDDGTTNNFGLRINGASGGTGTSQSLRVDAGIAALLGTIVVGTTNTLLTQAAALTLPEGNMFGVSGTLGAGTSISSMTLMTGREILLWASAGTVGFSQSNQVRIIGASFNIPQGAAVRAYCVGNTWFVFSPSS